MAATVKDRFDAAVNVIHSLPKDGPFQPSYEMMLSFYGYYKQATEGQCKKPKPWAWDVVAKKKWDAWTKLGEMPREEAMNHYVEELKKNIKSCSAQMDDMRQNGDSRIVEAMPQNQVVRDFMGKLGEFYDIVDEKLPGSDELQKHNQAGREDNMLGPSGSSGSSPEISSSELSEQGHEDDMDHSMLVESMLRAEGSEAMLQSLMRSEELASKIKSDMDELDSVLQADTNELDSALQADTNELDSALQADTNELDSALQADTKQLDSAMEADKQEPNLTMEADTTQPGETDKLTNGMDSESEEEFCDTSDQPSQEESEDSPKQTMRSVSTPLHPAHNKVGNHVHFSSSLTVQTEAEIHRPSLSPISKLSHDDNDNVTLTSDFTPGRTGNSRRRVHFTDSLLVHGPSQDSLNVSLGSEIENVSDRTQSSLSESSPSHMISQIDNVLTRGGGDSPPSGRSRTSVPPTGRGKLEPLGSRTENMYGTAGGTGGNLPSGSGGQGQGPPPFPTSQGGVNEQIAVALIRLQQDMNNVLSRLHNLETVAKEKESKEKHVKSRNTWTSRWWPFPSLRGRTFFFVLVWPIIVHWLLLRMFHRRRHQR